jgi:hypothetical protein
MKNLLSENSIEELAMELLGGLGYDYLHGTVIALTYADVCRQRVITLAYRQSSNCNAINTKLKSAQPVFFRLGPQNLRCI